MPVVIVVTESIIGIEVTVTVTVLTVVPVEKVVLKELSSLNNVFFSTLTG